MSELQGKYFAAGRALSALHWNEMPAPTKSGCKYCNKNRYVSKCVRDVSRSIPGKVYTVSGAELPLPVLYYAIVPLSEHVPQHPRALFDRQSIEKYPSSNNHP